MTDSACHLHQWWSWRWARRKRAFAHPIYYPFYGRRDSSRHDYLADRPQRDAGELEMRPGKGNADDRHRKNDGGDEMAERKPPAGEDEPDNVADHAKRPGADVGDARDLVAPY